MTAYILSLETASEVCSVALHHQGKLLATSACHLPQSHSKVLFNMIRKVLSLGQTSIAQLDAIAVSHGPGSYTGLRIGLSAAKGIAYGQDIPLITINTLAILAHSTLQATAHQASIGALIDARRGRAYTMVLDPQGTVITPTTLMHVKLDALPLNTLSTYPLYLVGSGAERYAAAIKTHPQVKVIQGMHPQAAHMGHLAYTKFQHKAWQDLATITPLYVSV